MKCPDCEIPTYELSIERRGDGEFLKCPRCGYRDNPDGKRYDWNQRLDILQSRPGLLCPDC